MKPTDRILLLAELLVGPLANSFAKQPDGRFAPRDRLPKGFGDGAHYLKLMRLVLVYARMFAPYLTVNQADEVRFVKHGLHEQIELQLRGNEPALVEAGLDAIEAAAGSRTELRGILLAFILGLKDDHRMDSLAFTEALLPP